MGGVCLIVLPWCPDLQLLSPGQKKKSCVQKQQHSWLQMHKGAQRQRSPGQMQQRRWQGLQLRERLKQGPAPDLQTNGHQCHQLRGPSKGQFGPGQVQVQVQLQSRLGGSSGVALKKRDRSWGNQAVALK